jgi:opacity protein-like surface antigen
MLTDDKLKIYNIGGLSALYNKKAIKMKMKKTIVLLSMLLMTASVKAQDIQSAWRIIPKIGVNLSTFYGDKVYTETGTTLKNKYKQGFTAGADLEWQMHENASLSLGLMYSNLGSRYGDFTWETKDRSENVSGQQYSLHYIQMPLMGSLYVTKGLAVKIGVQPGYLLSAKYEDSWMIKTVDSDKIATVVTEENNGSATAAFHRFDLTIPVGISYEYSNLVFDVRYNFGATKLFKIINEGNNRGFTFTVGYGFEL